MHKFTLRYRHRLDTRDQAMQVWTNEESILQKLANNLLEGGDYLFDGNVNLGGVHGPEYDNVTTDVDW